MKRALLCLSLLIINYGILSAEEQITITTYYPSPYGSYNALQADKLGVGDNNGDGSLTSADVPVTSGDVWIKDKVGIGTTGPLAKLAVVGQATFGTSAFTPPGTEPLSTIGTGSGISMNDRDGVSPRRVIYPSGDILRFWRSGTDQMVITSGGNLGIGTSAPGYKLEVAGDIYANDGWLRTGGATGWYNQDFGGGWNMSDSTWIRSYGGKNVYSDSVIRADGGFQVDGNQVIDADAGWHRTYGATGWYNGTYGGGWNMSDSTWIRSYGSKNVYIDQTLAVAGYVGIGTTTPGARLHVVNSPNHDVVFLTSPNDTIDLAVDWRTLDVWSVVANGWADVHGRNFVSSCDARLKKNVKTLTGVLDRLDAVRGVSFNWLSDNQRSIGVIAQEVEEVFPEVVTTSKPGEGKGNLRGEKSVSYDGVIAVTLQGLKELKAVVLAQAQEIKALKQRLNTLEKTQAKSK